MCVDPATAATISLVMGAIGTGVQAYGAMQAGKAEASQANYQAAVARNNKIIADQNANAAIQRGQVEEQDHRRRVQQVIGSQKAKFGASGVVIDSGSPLDIIADTAMMGELDAQTIRHNAEIEARQHRLTGQGFQAEAGLLQSRAGAARSAGAMSAAGTILGGGAQFADKWYRFKSEFG